MQTIAAQKQLQDDFFSILLEKFGKRCGNNMPATCRKVFGRFRKVLKGKKFFDLVRHRLDTYSGSRIHRRLRGVWLTLDYMCYDQNNS